MAVFGNLTEFPLLEVFGMLEQRTGVLRFARAGRYQALELHLNKGSLQGLLVNGLVMRDGETAKNILIELSGLRDGQFEFQRIPETSSELLNDLAIHVNGVMLRRATLDDEWNQYKHSLPDVETRFTLASEELIWLDGDLQAFWSRAEPLLEYGINAQVLSERLSLDLRLVQIYLFKLRSIGVVRPARRIQEVADIRSGQFPARGRASVLVPPPAPSKPTLVSRLLGALRLLRKPA